MGLEIERKFLVEDINWKSYTSGAAVTVIRQGYLSTEAERTVRVRLKDQEAFITIKGKTTGYSRAEFEYSIPAEDAKALLLLCKKPLIEKKRYTLEIDRQVWEIDEFFGENSGLVIAEAELAAEDQELNPPAWLGKEVTDDKRYFNSNLALIPYTKVAINHNQQP